MIEVKLLKDDDGHWYLVPNELSEQFFEDLDHEEFCDSGGFDEKYKKYRIGNVNSIQLFINEKDLKQ